ncbi:hypothetical protein [Alkalihalobacillus sp. BA299]|uniref:hypothetical protein n=1 Tax=Alkalihalobacillus sp. BA299 TaxID=2815938 RepID=UPI001ADB7809|nr:hypothetical protein [Alkalihalobacillus sp. BA299]
MGKVLSLGELVDFLKDKEKVREMLVFAGKCGAITTTRRGAIPALPSMDELMY